MEQNLSSPESHQDVSIVDEDEHNNISVESADAEIEEQEQHDGDFSADLLQVPDESQIKNSPLWKHFLVGKRHKRSGYREAFCRACIASTGTYVALRGDKPRMWRHLRSCPRFSRSELAAMRANGEFSKYEYVSETKKRKIQQQADASAQSLLHVHFSTNPNGLPDDASGSGGTSGRVQTIKFEPTRQQNAVYVLNSSSYQDHHSVTAVSPVTQTSEEFGTFVAMTLNQYPEVARSQLMKILKKEMAKFCLNYETVSE